MVHDCGQFSGLYWTDRWAAVYLQGSKAHLGRAQPQERQQTKLCTFPAAAGRAQHAAGDLAAGTHQLLGWKDFHISPAQVGPVLGQGQIDLSRAQQNKCLPREARVPSDHDDIDRIKPLDTAQTHPAALALTPHIDTDGLGVVPLYSAGEHSEARQTRAKMAAASPRPATLAMV